MPSVKLYTTSARPGTATGAPAPATPTTNLLPPLLHTPSGLAIVEIQGTIHAPFPASAHDSDSDMMMMMTTTTPHTQSLTNIGRLEFPLYDPAAAASDEEAGGKWMKKVYFYVGKHQRLVGEVKKLPKAVAVIRKRDGRGGGSEEEGEEEELEIAEIIRWKIVFGGRPEPVGGGGDDDDDGRPE